MLRRVWHVPGHEVVGVVRVPDRICGRASVGWFGMLRASGCTAPLFSSLTSWCVALHEAPVACWSVSNVG